MPSSIFVARLNRYFERLFNVKGGPAIIDINPSVQAEVAFQTGVEDKYLQAWNRFVGSFFVNAVAAQFSQVEIRNPAGSNTMVVVESFFLNGNTTAAIDYVIGNGGTNLATVQAAGTFLRRIDQRSGFTDSVSQLSSTNSATQFPGAASVIMRRPTTANEVIVTQNQELTLLPNDFLFATSDVVNVAISVNLVWRERGLEPSELTP